MPGPIPAAPRRLGGEAIARAAVYPQQYLARQRRVHGPMAQALPGGVWSPSRAAREGGACAGDGALRTSLRAGDSVPGRKSKFSAKRNRRGRPRWKAAAQPPHSPLRHQESKGPAMPGIPVLPPWVSRFAACRRVAAPPENPLWLPNAPKENCHMGGARGPQR